MSIIIESTRIKTRSGPKRILNHLLDKHEDNESITLIHGNRGDLADAFSKAKDRRKPSKFAIRHWIISSTEDMTEEQIHETVKSLSEEFGFDIDDSFLVKHEKERQGNVASRFHYHLCVPEILNNNRVMSDKNNYARHEKICRTLETDFGFTHIVGKHNKAVQFAVEDLRPDVSAVAEELAKKPLPKAQYTSKAKAEAERKGVDIKTLTRLAKNSVSENKAPAHIIQQINGLGLHIQNGDRRRKDGRYVPVIATDGGFVLGSVSGVLKLDKSEIDQFLDYQENKDKQRDNPQKSANLIDMLELSDMVKPAVGQSKNMSWTEYLDSLEKPLLETINQEHPTLGKRDMEDFKTVLNKNFKNIMENISKKKQDINNKRDILKQLQQQKQPWLPSSRNKKEQEEKKQQEEIAKIAEKIALMCQYLVECMLHKLGLISTAPNPYNTLTQEEKRVLHINYERSELAKLFAEKSNMQEGVKAMAYKKTVADFQELQNFKEREEVQECRKKLIQIRNLRNPDELDIDEIAKKELKKAMENNDFQGARSAVSNSEKREIEQYKKDLEQSQEQEPVQKKPVQRRGTSLSM